MPRSTTGCGRGQAARGGGGGGPRGGGGGGGGSLGGGGGGGGSYGGWEVLQFDVPVPLQSLLQLVAPGTEFFILLSRKEQGRRPGSHSRHPQRYYTAHSLGISNPSLQASWTTITTQATGWLPHNSLYNSAHPPHCWRLGSRCTCGESEVRQLAGVPGDHAPAVPAPACLSLLPTDAHCAHARSPTPP